MLKYFILWVLFCNTAFANPIVKKIIDGDTLDVVINTATIDNLIVRIRFKCSDTPECGEKCNKAGHSQYIGKIDIGEKSSEFTKNWLARHNYKIQLKCEKLGQYNRPECYIVANNENLNHLLIQEGYAVASEGYCNKEELQMMEFAKQNKKGLWALEWTEMPSKFRHKK